MIRTLVLLMLALLCGCTDEWGNDEMLYNKIALPNGAVMVRIHDKIAHRLTLSYFDASGKLYRLDTLREK